MQRNIIATVLLTTVLIATTGLLEAQPDQGGSKPHTLGKELMAYEIPVRHKIAKYVAMHTYPVAFDNNGIRFAWEALGSKTGGTALPGTTTRCEEDCIDITTIDYIMTESPPCIWPYKGFYGVVGVCWNAANRGLYYTGKTVSKVKFYPIIEAIYGTYGLDNNSFCAREKCRKGRDLYGWSRCLQAVEELYPWQGQERGELAAGGTPTDPRIALFENYFFEGTARTGNNPDRQALYMRELFDININENLGIDFRPEARRYLHAIRLHAAEMVRFVDFDNDDQSTYLQEINNIINLALSDISNELSDDEYYSLMGTRKDDIFDIRILK